jgi:lipopolysaccharide exporter
MIGRPVIEGANLLAMAVLARLVAPAEFGRYTIALIVLVLATIPTMAVHYPIVQRKQIDRDLLRTGQTITMLMGLGVCAFCVGASFTVVPLVFGARTAMLVRLMVPACFLNSVNTVQYALITRRLEFRRLSLLDMTTTLVGAAVSIPLAAMGLNAVGMVIGVIAGSTAGLILIWCWVRPPLPNFRLRAARDILRSGLPAASNSASLVGFQNCDYVIVGARLGALQAGYYFRAYTLGVSYQTKVSLLITSLGFPVLSRVPNEDEVHRLRQRMTQILTLIVFPLLTLLAIVAPKFVTWFYGSEWRAVVIPVQILAIGGGVMLVAQVVSTAMLGTGRARAVMLWGWGHFLTYAAAVFAVARLGLPAVAAAAVVVHTTFLIISYLQLFRGRIREAFVTLAKDVLPAAASCAGLVAVALPVSVSASKMGIPVVPYLLIVAIAGSAGYFLILRLWFPNELRYLGVLGQRLLPPRAHRLFGRMAGRPAPQSAS